MKDYSAYIPKGTMEFPDAPEHHKWEIKNVIQADEKTSHYIVEVRLFNLNNVAVITIVEEWDVKVESFNDFAITVAGLSSVALSAYESFKSINWGRDNINFSPSTMPDEEKDIQVWSSQ